MGVSQRLYCRSYRLTARKSYNSGTILRHVSLSVATTVEVGDGDSTTCSVTGRYFQLQVYRLKPHDAL